MGPFQKSTHRIHTGRIICQNKMGFTLKVLMCVFGFVLIIKTIPTDAEDEIAKREDGELPCIWQCPIILDKCLLKGGGKSLCNKVAQRCNSICIAEETHVKKSREISGIRQCRQECYGLFEQCGTVTTTIEAHILCIRAKSQCTRSCIA